MVGDAIDFCRRFSAGPAFSAGHVNAQIVAEVFIGFLHRPAGDGGDAGGMPVESEHAAEGLKPPGIGKPAKHFGRAVGINHSHRDRAGELPHAAKKPGWSGAGMQRKMGELTLHQPVSLHAKIGNPAL